MTSGSLRRQLTIRVTIIAAIATVLLMVASTIAVRQMLVKQLDQQLAAAFVRQHGGPTKFRDTSPGEALALPGAEVGTIVAYESPQGERLGAIIRDGRPPVIEPLSPSAMEQLLATSLSDSQTVRLTATNGDSATYRVSLRGSPDGVWAVGLPMTEINAVTTRLIAVELGLAIIVVAAGVIASRMAVQRSLRPLDRLAAAADEVSRLDLATGEVSLDIRIPDADADEDSEVGRVGRAFNLMLSNVEGALAARQRSETHVRQFVADASHELRNPLASIRGYSELCRRERDALPEATAHALTRIDAESARMSHLVEDMLLLARLDAGRGMQLSDVDVVELVLNAVDDARVAGPAHRWELALPAEPVIVRADPDQLHQAVSNVLTNAWRHTPDGTRVQTSIHTNDAWACIRVCDDGPGIPESIRDHVFERFARADESRTDSQHGSSGLGLAIVASILQALGGSATVESSDAGTTFDLFIPLR